MGRNRKSGETCSTAKEVAGIEGGLGAFACRPKTETRTETWGANYLVLIRKVIDAWDRMFPASELNADSYLARQRRRCEIALRIKQLEKQSRTATYRLSLP
jgi:hypothetical protein